jgi:hypothetical protein
MSLETSKTGLKTLDKIVDISIVSNTLDNVNYYYNNVKELNSLTKVSFNIAETSCKTGINLIAPIVNYVNKPSNL